MRMGGPLGESAKLLTLLAASWLTPIERLGPCAAALRRGRKNHAGDRPGTSAIAMAYLLSDRASLPDAAELFWRWENRSRETAMQILALLRPGRSWRPVITLTGLEHLAAARRRGGGAILWISDFVYRPLIVPLALRQAGFAAIHLSRPEHGFSVSPFGVRHLNPLWVAVENRFLAERIVIENNDAAAALATLRERLAGNAVVSITVAETGRRTLDVPFLRGSMRVATGPVHLSRTAGAPLLPVFAVRKEDGSYLVAIGEALDVEARSDPPYAAAIHAYARGLEPFVLAYPDQWNGWIALGRLLEATPAFADSFGCGGALRRDIERFGEALPG